MKKITRPDHSQVTITAATSNSTAAHRSGRLRVNVQWLKDFISEMLATERGAVQLYQRTLEQLWHEELRSKLHRYLRETEEHVELCAAMLEVASAEPGVQSPGAVATERKLQCLMDVKVSGDITDINNVENLFLAETKDQRNWAMLKTLMEQMLEHSQIKTVVRKAVQKVERQECDHASWNQQVLTKLSRAAASRTNQ